MRYIVKLIHFILVGNILGVAQSVLGASISSEFFVLAVFDYPVASWGVSGKSWGVPGAPKDWSPWFLLGSIWGPAVCIGKYGKNTKFWGRKRGEEKEKSTFSLNKFWKIGQNQQNRGPVHGLIISTKFQLNRS